MTLGIPVEPPTLISFSPWFNPTNSISTSKDVRSVLSTGRVFVSPFVYSENRSPSGHQGTISLIDPVDYLPRKSSVKVYPTTSSRVPLSTTHAGYLTVPFSVDVSPATKD